MPKNYFKYFDSKHNRHYQGIVEGKRLRRRHKTATLASNYASEVETRLVQGRQYAIRKELGLSNDIVA